jgi:hypothetical protein
MSSLDRHLSALHAQAANRLAELTERIGIEDLTALELLAFLAVLESADKRLHAPSAPVLQLV